MHDSMSQMCVCRELLHGLGWLISCAFMACSCIRAIGKASRMQGLWITRVINHCRNKSSLLTPPLASFLTAFILSFWIAFETTFPDQYDTILRKHSIARVYGEKDSAGILIPKDREKIRKIKLIRNSNDNDNYNNNNNNSWDDDRDPLRVPGGVFTGGFRWGSGV